MEVQLRFMNLTVAALLAAVAAGPAWSQAPEGATGAPP
jgi:hypothetical protein